MCVLIADKPMGFRIRTVDLLYTLPGTIRTEFTHNPWVSALWDTVLKGKTLVDVVAGIFTGVTSAVQAVKDGLSAAWDGIKSAENYIRDSVLSIILSSTATMMNSLISGLMNILQMIFTNSDNISSLRVLSDSMELIFQFEDSFVPFDMFTPETLSLSSNPLVGTLVLLILSLLLQGQALAFGYLGISALANSSPDKANLAGITLIVSSIILTAIQTISTFPINNPNDAQREALYFFSIVLVGHYLGLGIMSINNFVNSFVGSNLNKKIRNVPILKLLLASPVVVVIINTVLGILGFPPIFKILFELLVEGTINDDIIGAIVDRIQLTSIGHRLLVVLGLMIGIFVGFEFNSIIEANIRTGYTLYPFFGGQMILFLSSAFFYAQFSQRYGG